MKPLVPWLGFVGLLYMGLFTFAAVTRTPPLPKVQEGEAGSRALVQLNQLAPQVKPRPRPEPKVDRRPASFAVNPDEKLFIYGRCTAAYGRTVYAGQKGYEECMNGDAPYNENGPWRSKSVGLLLLLP